ncbi:MAG: hypothetical protein ACRDGD_08710 [Candidatus Limnocylindria bacterium]
MAVRAHDIALLDFGQDSVVACSADERWNARGFGRGIAMIEVHRARRKPSATIQTRHVLQIVKHRCLSAPSRALLLEPLRGSRDPVRRPGTMLDAGAKPVAVRAHDVAFGYLGEHLRGCHEGGPSRSDIERLRGRIAVIEVHLMGLERPAAIGARHPAKVAQELDHAVLSYPDTMKLQVAVTPVVLDVVFAL